MKRKIGFLVALLALVAGMMFTSCERLNELWNEVKDELVKEEGKWYEYDVEYEVTAGSKLYMECYILYSDKDYSNTGMLASYVDANGEPVKNSTKLPAGLTVCFVPIIDASKKAGTEDDAYKALVSQLFGQATGNIYAMKTFAKDQPITEDSGIKANLTTWSLISGGLYESLQSANIPAPIKKTTASKYNNIEIDGVSSFDWKKLVAIAILNKIINE